MTETFFDGAGRPLRTRTPHTGTSWSAVLAEYDILGRIKKQSVPTEVSVPNINDPNSWTPAGDDNRGLDGSGNPVWLWTHQKYDWMGRVVRKINTDGIDQETYNDSDILISYEGCGCAGGLVTTVESELVLRDDTSANARRKQKTYEDILGRTWKTVVYKWDGTTAYTTTQQTFNGRDQVLTTKQIDNTSTATPQKSQEITMTYDGHGRMKTRHYPIEDSGAYTDWTYNPDDSISQIIDPRLAITNFTYDSRGLTTQIAYTPPSGSSVPDTPTVTYAYDNVGNRTSMDTDGVSLITYAYDSLSRMTSETVDFDDLTSNYTVGYTYNIGGGLKSISDPFSSTVDYTNDKTGRLTAVDGTAWGPNTTGDYANNIKYRAFGEMKQMDYVMPNGTSQIKLEYDDRLRVSQNSVTEAGSTTSFLMKANFAYAPDSRLKEKDDLLDNKWDRTMKHDFAGRLKFNQFGMGLGSDGFTVKRVYEQTISYDGFSNMTGRTGVHWDDQMYYDAQSFTNGRIDNNPDINYDAAGNLSHIDSADPWTFTINSFDASGRRTGSFTSTKGRAGSYLNWVSQNKSEQKFDGDGRPVIEKRNFRGFPMTQPPSGSFDAIPHLYQVWSTVLGSVLTTITPAGGKQGTSIYAGKTVIASQGRTVVSGQNQDSVGWSTADPQTGTGVRFNFFAGGGGGSGAVVSQQEPLGQMLHLSDPAALPGPEPNEIFTGFASDPEWQCQIPREFYGSFSAMPFHCQLKMLKDISNTLEEIYEPERTPEDPTKVAHELIDSPLPDAFSPDHGASFASKTLMSFALTSSDKKKDKDKKPKAVPDIHLPEEHVEVKIPEFEEKILEIDMSDSGWVEASESVADRAGGLEMRGQDSLQCPERESGLSFSAATALEHYVERTGKPVYISIDEIQADFPFPSSFPAVQRLVKEGTKGKSSITHKIEYSHSNPVQVGGWQRAVLGRITFDLNGTLKIYEWGLAEFSGTIGVINDTYDFDAGDRTLINQASTAVGSFVPGKPYDVVTVGRYDVKQAWNRYGTRSSSCK